MTPHRGDRRKRRHESLGMAAETAVVLGCIATAIAIVCWGG